MVTDSGVVVCCNLGFWSVFHTVKADDSVTPAQFLELQSLPNFNDHPLVSQPVRMKHSIGVSSSKGPISLRIVPFGLHWQ